MVRYKIKTKDGLRKTTLELTKKASVKTEAFYLYRFNRIFDKNI